MQQPILLGGYAAKQCPVRVQNDFLPLVPTLRWVPSPDDQARLDAGIAFERSIFENLTTLHPAAVVVVDPQLGKAEAITMTVEAMDAGASLVLGGWLPDDVEGGRTGRPDILIKVDRGYLPADVKNHFTVKPSKTRCAVVSSLASPACWLTATGWSAATTHRYEDGFQLAHYTRMLQACGYHSGPDQLRGAVLGTSQLEVTPHDGPELVFMAQPKRAAGVHVLPQPRQDAAVAAGTPRPRTRLPRQGGRKRPANHWSRRRPATSGGTDRAG